MRYLKKHLSKSEKIIAFTHKSPIIFIRELFVLMVLYGIIATFMYGFKWGMDKMQYVYISCSVVFVLFLLSSFIKIISTNLLVSTNKFMYKEDLISITVYDTQLQNIDGVKVEYKTPFQRLFNSGSIIIMTRNNKIKLKYILKPDIFAAKLNNQASKLAENRAKKVDITFGIGPAPIPADKGRVVTTGNAVVAGKKISKPKVENQKKAKHKKTK